MKKNAVALIKREGFKVKRGHLHFIAFFLQTVLNNHVAHNFPFFNYLEHYINEFVEIEVNVYSIPLS